MSRLCRPVRFWSIWLQ